MSRDTTPIYVKKLECILLCIELGFQRYLEAEALGSARLYH